jgi:hypothetical protein
MLQSSEPLLNFVLIYSNFLFSFFKDVSRTKKTKGQRENTEEKKPKKKEAIKKTATKN